MASCWEVFYVHDSAIYRQLYRPENDHDKHEEVRDYVARVEEIYDESSEAVHLLLIANLLILHLVIFIHLPLDFQDVYDCQDVEYQCAGRYEEPEYVRHHHKGQD